MIQSNYCYLPSKKWRRKPLLMTISCTVLWHIRDDYGSILDLQGLVHLLFLGDQSTPRVQRASLLVLSHQSPHEFVDFCTLYSFCSLSCIFSLVWVLRSLDCYTCNMEVITFFVSYFFYSIYVLFWIILQKYVFKCKSSIFLRFFSLFHLHIFSFK